MAAFFLAMHLLYLDESGTASDPNQRFYVLAGISVFERKTHFIEQEMNKIAERFNKDDPHSIELHGSPMRSGRDGWKQFHLQDRMQAIRDALAIIPDQCQRDPRCTRLFGAVIKREALRDRSPVEFAFEQMARRFDMFLQKSEKSGNRGVILLDKSSTERDIQRLAREFKYTGHQWGKTRCFAEVPVFLDSKASRLIQLADLVAFALFRFNEYEDNSFYSIINKCFHTVGHRELGLYTLYSPNSI